jgi:hypothetical protein
MYVWSTRLVIALLSLFTLFIVLFFFQGTQLDPSTLKTHTTRWILANYVGLVIWIFVWMVDQARGRAKNVLLWLGPFILAPLPTLMLFVLALQRRMQ